MTPIFQEWYSSHEELCFLDEEKVGLLDASYFTVSSNEEQEILNNEMKKDQ